LRNRRALFSDVVIFIFLEISIGLSICQQSYRVNERLRPGCPSTSGFAPALLLKDLKICRALTEEAGFASSILGPALDYYQRLVDRGETGKDISALIRQKRRDGGS